MSDGYDTDYEGRPSDELAQQLAAEKPSTFECAICMKSLTRTHCLLHKQVDDKANICKADICWNCFRRHVQVQAKRQELLTDVFPRCPLCRGRLVTYVNEEKVDDIPSFLVPSQEYLLETLGRKYGLAIFLFGEQFAIAFEQGPMAAILRNSLPCEMRLDNFVEQQKLVGHDEWPTIDSVYESVNAIQSLEFIVDNAKMVGTIYELNID
jgi:uncharacterized protein with PIN domain